MSDVARLLQDLRELHPCITVYESVGSVLRGWAIVCDACGRDPEENDNHPEGQYSDEYYCLNSPVRTHCGTCVDAEEGYALWPCPTGELIQKWERHLVTTAFTATTRHCSECEERSPT